MTKRATRESFGQALAELALENRNIVALNADVSKSTKTAELRKVAPERHFNMGIAEANMMGVAAGLALNGKIPFASCFAMFATGRAFDQIRNSIAYPHLNVKICASHAGLSVGPDGATHQCNEDIALMRVLPGMTVIQPCDDIETRQAVRAASGIKGPVYIRLGRSAVDDVNDESYVFEPGKGVVLHQGKDDVTIFATGLMVQESLKALLILNEKEIDPTVINIHTIKPLDDELVLEYAHRSRFIVTREEHSIIGGLGSAVSELLATVNPVKQIFIGVNDCFGESGTPAELFRKYGLSAEKIAERIESEYKKQL